MARTVPEWIGKTDDSRPSTGCMRRILDRQGWRCALTGTEFRDGVKAEFDHVVPIWLGGENRESNLHAITVAAHDGKTKSEAKVRAKVNRIQLSRVNASAPKQSISSRGFPRTKAEREPKPELPRRAMYERVET